VLVGRESELAAIARVLESARAGRAAALCLEGDAGVGKTALLAAAEARAEGFRCLRGTGVEADVGLAHAALLELLCPVRPRLGDVPVRQRETLGAALGWTAGPAGGEPFLVAAATMSLLAAAAGEGPVLVVLDDVQWVDRETVRAVAFAARRLRHDRVAVLLARRPRSPEEADDLAGLPVAAVRGLGRGAAAALLAGRVAPSVADRLAEVTAGNPLALEQLVGSLSAEQRRGSAALPELPPLGERLAAGYAQRLRRLPAPARRAVLLAALTGPDVGPVLRALGDEGLDAGALEEAERSGVLELGPGTVGFPHPLVRAAAVQVAPADLRSGHAALARALDGDPDRRTRHRALAAVGPDPELAADLAALAGRERRRRGFASAADLQERAARLQVSEARTAAALAIAVEDALLAGDPPRVRRLAGEVLRGAADPAARGRALLGLGTLEHYAGSVPEAGSLLRAAVGCAEGPDRVRALTELAFVGYRLGSPAAVAEAAAEMRATADPQDAEQAALADFTEAMALAFGGRWAQARGPALRALDRLETDPRLRDAPRHLVVAVLAPSWAAEVSRARAVLERRLAAARAAGALGVLPPVLCMVAGWAVATGEHRLAYAVAGEAAELGRELGYVADLATTMELLAFEEAARGRHAAAAGALAAARDLGRRAGVAEASVQLHLVDAVTALCRGDLPRVVEVLMARLAADGGRLPRGDYELAVVPDLAEALLGLGRRADAAGLAARHAALHRGSADPVVRSHVDRLAGLLAEDDEAADAAFAGAHEAAVAGGDPLGAARTLLLHGARLRRAGRRVDARVRLRAAAAAFDAMGLDGWRARALDELAATGLRVRRGAADGGLTSQETRVALLVAEGLTNRDIATALFLSPKTVEHHVTSILRKRGLRSRSAVAAAFAGGEAAP
jgi:DNA-binding CsgD family transcriptional regulator/tetratricopeptide (TPR) repeat protein